MQGMQTHGQPPVPGVVVGGAQVGRVGGVAVVGTSPPPQVSQTTQSSVRGLTK